jgi:ABC-type molybdenum transport system ATPase subunit/photorepair protein PhrA
MLDSLCLHLGTTLIYVTHYADEIPKSIQYLLELEAGRVKSCGEFHIPEE